MPFLRESLEEHVALAKITKDVPAGLPKVSWPMQTSEDLALAKETVC